MSKFHEPLRLPRPDCRASYHAAGWTISEVILSGYRERAAVVPREWDLLQRKMEAAPGLLRIQRSQSSRTLRIQYTQADPVIETFRFPTLDGWTTNEAGFCSSYDHNGSTGDWFFRLHGLNLDSATAHVALSVV